MNIWVDPTRQSENSTTKEAWKEGILQVMTNIGMEPNDVQDWQKWCLGTARQQIAV
jgi:hypothetical protein